MMIRTEQPSDFQEIYTFVKTAFSTAKVKDGDEQDFVNRLRAGGSYIPALALVAEEQGKIIGHSMLTKTQLKANDQVHEVLLFAPLAVALEHRNQGIGGKLIAESFRIAKELGYHAVFLCGDPKYYQRFGFRCIAEFGITDDGGVPWEYIMAYELTPNWLSNKKGGISHIA